MKLTLIAGIAENNVIGTEGDLPWHISEDLKRFKTLTLGNPVIMGRKTYESIIKRLGKPLQNRTNVVVTRQQEYAVPEDVIVAESVEDAIKKAEKFGDNIFVIGGEQIYEQTIGIADRLEITHVHRKFEGDVYFPSIGTEWKEVKKEEKQTDEGLKYTFTTYEKAGKMNLKELTNLIMNQAQEKGFGVKPQDINVAEKISLIHSEVSEAYDAYRKKNIDGKDGFREELGDVIQRVLHLAGIFDINLEEEILKKIEHNKNRDWKWNDMNEKNTKNLGDANGK